ncbi:MAG TPA: hypothetical protein VEC16_06045 [Alphaproteobacteria bacterium]|nr:hypothetical protein [Alphaproteobacteria bacterium]
MIEIERFIGNGAIAALFRVRGDHSLAVKIIFNRSDNLKKEILERELKVSRTLKELGVDIPTYESVIQVKIPEHIEQTFLKSSAEVSSRPDFYKQMKQYFIDHKGQTVWGLVMENIPDDSIVLQCSNKTTLISKNRISKIFEKEYEKIHLLGISTVDSASYTNIIWSESKAKLYFIDFADWDLSGLGNEKTIARNREWINQRKLRS